MENVTIMGMILKKLEQFDDTYACVGIEKVNALPNGFQIAEGKYATLILPEFDENQEISIFPFNAEPLIKSGYYQSYDEIKEDKTYPDRSLVYIHQFDEETGVKRLLPLINMYTDKIELDFNGQKEVENKDEEIIDIKSIDEEVRKSIIGQDDAIKQILSTIYFNQRLYDSDLPYDKLRNLKQNILLVGSTGVGKTEIIKQIAKQLDIPCVIEDATRYTIEGYKGNSIEDMIKHLYESADYDIELAERSILVIDEIDKKSANEDVSSISSTGVQQSLLKLLEGTNYNISGDHENMLEPFEFDSSYLTIIL